MRLRFRKIHSSGSIDSTPESRYACIRTAGWLMRILDKRVVVNSQLLDCAAWCLGGLDTCLHGLIEESKRYSLVSKTKDELQVLMELKRVSLFNLTNSLEDSTFGVVSKVGEKEIYRE